jgi:hypothetical protein
MRRGTVPIIHTLGTRHRQAVTLVPQPLYTQENIPPPHPIAQWIVNCVGLRASLEILEMRKNSCPCLELNPELFSTWHLNSTTCYSLSNYMTPDFRPLHAFKYSHCVYWVKWRPHQSPVQGYYK